MHIGGVFNNIKSRTLPDGVPHRADIPNDKAVTVVSASLIAAAVDLEGGIFTNRTVARCKEGATTAVVELSTYAHRAHRSLLVLELHAPELKEGSNCTVSFQSCALGMDAITDFDVTASDTLTVKHMEQPRSWSSLPELPTTTVGVATEPLPDTVTLIGGSAPMRFLSVYRTSLEPGLTNETVGKAAQQQLMGFKDTSADELRASHTAAWGALWATGGIEVGGNATIAGSVNSSLYYILSAVREDWPYGLSPGGISRDDYFGHSFWDCETWMFPVMAALQPDIAASLTRYRLARLPAAQARARHVGLQGAMMPWESALTGFGESIWRPGDDNEIHITGDVPMAFRLYYRVARNTTWLQQAWPLLRDAADFFASRAVLHKGTGNWTWLQVISPDEGAGIHDGNAYTNAIAGETIRFALETAARFGYTPHGNWSQIAARIFLPLVTIDGLEVHPEYTNYSVKTRPYINQADVALMQYPLMLPMDPTIAKNDLLFYQARSSGPSTAGFYTGDSAYSIAWLQLGNRSAADAQFDLAFEHMDLEHFNVWKEKSFGNFGNLNFITGAGGYLQNYVNGYAGVRYSDAGLSFRPCLPPHGVTSLTLRGLSLGQARFRVGYNTTTLEVDLLEGPKARIGLHSGIQYHTLEAGSTLVLQWRQGDVFDVTLVA